MFQRKPPHLHQDQLLAHHLRTNCLFVQQLKHRNTLLGPATQMQYSKTRLMGSKMISPIHLQNTLPHTSLSRFHPQVKHANQPLNLSQKKETPQLQLHWRDEMNSQQQSYTFSALPRRGHFQSLSLIMVELPHRLSTIPCLHQHQILLL
jgi:hypothetical protein